MPSSDGRKTALITGVTGQDGSYLAELLLSKNYQVCGVIRRSSNYNTMRIDHIYQDPHEKNYRFRLVYGDLSDASSVARILRRVRPDEIYNLGAQSFVQASFEIPEYTADVDALGVIRILEGVREAGLDHVRIYQASSSEMYGKAVEIPQNENTPFYPRSPYGCAKAFGFHIARNYRESYGMFVCNGILFNHESPRRGRNFVTRKITYGVASMLKGKMKKLYLGNLDAKRDWGFAGDYVEAMWLMMQQDQPDDYVIATGEAHSVRECLEEAFSYVGLKWQDHVEVDPRYFRPAEVDILLGDPSKARRNLKWEPKVHFRELVRMMVDADIHLLEHPQ